METEILDAKAVRADDLRTMVSLMEGHYENVTTEAFCADLARKDRVAVFRDRGRIRGFSTLAMLTERIDAIPVRVFFSGDTVMDRSCRNSVALPLAIAREMLRELDRAPDEPLYWLLTSKGYKTFRSLPVFFRDFWPRAGRTLLDFESRLLAAVCARLFGGRLDPDRWILRASDSDQRLRPGVADITDTARSRPDIACFERLNPGHVRGDELVCLALFSRGNLRPDTLRRLLLATAANPAEAGPEHGDEGVGG